MEKFLEKQVLGRLRRIWEDNIKKQILGTHCGNMN